MYRKPLFAVVFDQKFARVMYRTFVPFVVEGGAVR